jgi:hypothetical protein
MPQVDRDQRIRSCEQIVQDDGIFFAGQSSREPVDDCKTLGIAGVRD